MVPSTGWATAVVRGVGGQDEGVGEQPARLERVAAQQLVGAGPEQLRQDDAGVAARAEQRAAGEHA